MSTHFFQIFFSSVNITKIMLTSMPHVGIIILMEADMNTFFDNNQLTLVFEGRIDTSNALNVDKEVMAAYEEHRYR